MGGSIMGFTGVSARRAVLLALLSAAFYLTANLAQRTKADAQSLFNATPLIDLSPSKLYLNRFAGLLYASSNTPTGLQDAIARNGAAAIVPLNANGQPSRSGAIGVVAIGMSNWTGEICVGSNTKVSPARGCAPDTFMDQIQKAQAAGTINPALIIVDCAQAGQDANAWANPGSSAWATCLNRRLVSAGITAQQVEAVLWKDGDITPAFHGLSSLASLPGLACSSADTLGIDACYYEMKTGAAARLIYANFSSVRLLFLQSRTYGGYANLAGSDENPEPYANEYGFATKWLIQAQNNQLNGGGIDPVAGDLSLQQAPVMIWGPYLWASGTEPRSDGLVWLRSDFQSDGTHTTQSGWTKVSDMLMNFYTTSPYAAPWFD